MINATYQSITLDWIPDSRNERNFHLITAIVVTVMCVLAIIISNIDVPEKEREQVVEVPPRIAQYISEQQPPEVEPPQPTPLPTPVPIPTPRPTVAREVEKVEEPLTESEVQAREKAEQSGLLALGNELADLIDTSDVDDMVRGEISESDADSQQAAGHGTDVLTAGIAEGSGGVDSDQYMSGGVSSTQLSRREVALVKQTLFKDDVVIKAKGGSGSGERGGNVRSEEEVTIVFDQHKGTLYSIYNRERRKKPGLKGKIVLELTISPAGAVTNVRIISSELNDPTLESRLVSRVKLFKFDAKEVEPVTVTFPIEFLPS